MMAPAPLNVLIVDDSEADFLSTRDLLARADETAFVARWAPSYEAGLAAIVADRPDVCLVDYDLDGHEGEDFVRDAQRQGALAAMVLLAGYESLGHVAETHNSGVDNSLLKWKLTPTLLERSVHHAIEIHRMRAQVQELHQRFHDLADSAGVIYFECDPQSKRPMYVSPAYESLVGQSCADACGMPRAWLQYVHTDDHDRVLASLDDSRYDDLEFRVVRRDGSVRWFRCRAQHVESASGRVSRVVGIAEDVSTLRMAERRAAATNRLETLGRLAGGVAHDVINMLSAIIGEAEQLRYRLTADDPLHSGVQEIIDESWRASHLTRQLLTFGRAKSGAQEELRVSELVRRVERMLHHLVGTNVELVTVLPDDAGCVVADVCDVEQVVLNLVVNARDAMPNGGRLRISTGNVRVGADYAMHADVAPGDYVVLSVNDDGVGMTDDVLAHIFEPFFTTKEQEGGSGLGLCTVRDLVERNGGAINVQTEWGRGSTFTVLLPRARGELAGAECAA